ncbi:hypothetical protein GCM10018980_56740 [Streptomyces capoamus]|uniref:Uncharacterized protein n=1 Tax=Streptomyces capoamus TaxID=68183 RepID=A0A919F0S3_9ACTN|nr:hypothetical protein GCM10010501_56830 [Streptomyces libani subsp. rufus]GHG65185.1 hypothetical protein GCM10018980_56740 [Streptomyces capoamus]
MRGDEDDVRARRDERREAALGDLAAAEDDHAAAGEAEAYGVGGVFGHEGRLLVQLAMGALRLRSGPDVQILSGGRAAGHGWSGS